MVVSRDTIDRFWSHVNIQGPDDCCEWQASRTSFGYGRPSINGKSIQAHRFSYELKYGFGSALGLKVRHTCDNPPCVNPKHLLLGTQKQNVTDMYERGRQNPCKGGNHWNAKLSEDDISEIKRLSAEGVIQRRIAEKFNVSYSGISLILREARRGNGPTKSGMVKGSECPWAKLTEEDVKIIKEMILNGVVQRRIAEKFNVDPATICYIKKGVSWKHLKE